MRISFAPLRLATGAYILHAGWEKWHGDEVTAKGLHHLASGAYPALEDVEPKRFLKMLGAGEVGLGTILLAPMVPAAAAGVALSGFSAALLGVYARTPGMRQPGKIWPTQEGTGISKDVWMLGIGLSLITGGLRRRKR